MAVISLTLFTPILFLAVHRIGTTTVAQHLPREPRVSDPPGVLFGFHHCGREKHAGKVRTAKTPVQDISITFANGTLPGTFSGNSNCLCLWHSTSKFASLSQVLNFLCVPLGDDNSRKEDRLTDGVSLAQHGESSVALRNI